METSRISSNRNEYLKCKRFFGEVAPDLGLKIFKCKKLHVYTVMSRFTSIIRSKRLFVTRIPMNSHEFP